jgi:hypothetical protein
MNINSDQHAFFARELQSASRLKVGFLNNVIKKGTRTEWTTPDFRNTPSTTNLEGEEIVDTPGKDGNASMPDQVRRTNPWRKKMMIMMMMMMM